MGSPAFGEGRQGGSDGVEEVPVTLVPWRVLSERCHEVEGAVGVVAGVAVDVVGQGHVLWNIEMVFQSENGQAADHHVVAVAREFASLG
ncbi:hypothetical protein D9M69_672990 [compost metagenome]